MGSEAETPYNFNQYNGGRVTGPCGKDFWSDFPVIRRLERESEREYGRSPEAPSPGYTEKTETDAAGRFEFVWREKAG